MMEEEIHGRFPQKLSLEWWKLRHPSTDGGQGHTRRDWKSGIE
jgi:hypothetical protein